jgi:two-component system cell cycle sensor histidine kinase/response regulator CckA
MPAGRRAGQFVDPAQLLAMSFPISVLVVEDSPEDAELMVLELRRSGFVPQWQRVDSEEPFLAALRESPDVVLADFNMPQFSALRLLELLESRQSETPVIVVSGSVGEEVAVEMIRRGATDYLLKDRLARLGPAVRHALTQRQLREQSRAATEALRASEKRLAEAQRIARVGSWDWELTTNQLIWSAGLFALFELDPTTFTPSLESFRTLVHPQDWPRLDAVATAHVQTGAPFDCEHRVRLPSGREIIVRAAAQRELDAHGKVVRVRGIAQDITAERQLEDQRRQSQKLEAIGRLAGGVAHDFNNLLTVILGYSELALGQLEPEVSAEQILEVRQHVDAIRDAGHRAAALTKQLLAFSRQQVLEPKVLDLNEIVSRMEAMLRRLIGEDIILTSLLEPQLSPVRVDPSQLEQVILNLAVNARDAMPGGGRLALETGMVEVPEVRRTLHGEIQPGHYVRLSVCDSGAGMTPDIQARIFEPFFTTKSPGHGTGLGLATVYGVVTQSDGWISVASTLGNGTRFDVQLPAVGAPPHSAAERRLDGHGRFAGQETILLVEDEEAVRVLTRAALERLGYRVLEAEDGETAVRLANDHQGQLDLLITDVVMPGINGRQLAEKLVIERSTLKVLFVSGYTEDAVVRHGIADRSTNFLQKPFNLSILGAKVREILDGGGIG